MKPASAAEVSQKSAKSAAKPSFFTIAPIDPCPVEVCQSASPASKRATIIIARKDSVGL